MKIILSLLVSAIIGITAVSAATGSTSTGSTSTGSVSTGSTSTGSTSTGSTNTGVVVSETSVKGAGGPIRAWNYTSNQWDMLPQCFPWTWMDLFLAGNISAIYENQKVCREQRTIDFH